MSGFENRIGLFELLPAVYRSLDIAAGSPLQALAAVMQAQYDAIDGNIEQLYDDWFIESCQTWVTPYIGALVGIERLVGPDAAVEPIRRALVADVIAFTRRKGTVNLLQALSWAATGWPARAVEALPRLVATQSLAAPRPGRAGYVNIADTAALSALDTPFDPLSHRARVDKTAAGACDTLGGVSVFLWRLTAFPLAGIVAAPDATVSGGYRFDALGRDLQLFAPPDQPTPRDRPAGPRALPLPITRGALARDLAAYRQRWGQSEAPPPDSEYYGPARGLVVTVAGEALGPLDITVADLGAWTKPLPTDVALLDPERGRLMIGNAAAVMTDYAYGFAAAIGGGPYERRQRMIDPATAPWSLTVGQGGAAANIADALAQWQAAAPSAAVITILDSATYGDLPSSLSLPAGSRLCLQAADEERPAVALPAPLQVSGAGAVLELSGLLMQGGLCLADGVGLVLKDSTLLPPAPAIAPAPITTLAGAHVTVTIERSIAPALALPATATLTIVDSVLDPFGAAASIAGTAASPTGPLLDSLRVTVIGAVAVTGLSHAQDSLFLAPVTVADAGAGSCTYSYVPDGSVLPGSYRNQPMLALAEAAAELGLRGPGDLPPAIRAAVIAAMTPCFTSLTLPAPGYAQLALNCASQITAGASDGAAMGAFNELREPQLRRVLARLLARFAPLGVVVDTVFMT